MRAAESEKIDDCNLSSQDRIGWTRGRAGNLERTGEYPGPPQDHVIKYAASPEDNPPAQSDLFTNDLVGKIEFSADEWKAAEAKAQPFRAYLS
jgi:hypothetical protein